MRTFVIPVFQWTYIFSVLFAKDFWSGVYDGLALRLDLSPNQAWFMPLALNLAVACAGIPQVVGFLGGIRRREGVSPSRHVASSMCIGAVCVCLAGTVVGFRKLRRDLAAGVAEAIGGNEGDVFTASQIVNGRYSNIVIGVSLDVPTGWHPMSLSSIRRAKQSGAHAISANDPQETEETGGTPPGVYALAAFGRQPPYNVRSGPLQERFGTEIRYHLHLEGRFPGTIVQQHLFLVEADGFFILATASAVDEVDLAVTVAACMTLRVRRKGIDQ